MADKQINLLLDQETLDQVRAVAKLTGINSVSGTIRSLIKAKHAELFHAPSYVTVEQAQAHQLDGKVA